MRQKEKVQKKEKITKRKENTVKGESKRNFELFEEFGHLTTDKTGKIFKI